MPNKRGLCGRAPSTSEVREFSEIRLNSSNFLAYPLKKYQKLPARFGPSDQARLGPSAALF